MRADLQPYGRMKESYVEWLGPVPEHWEIATTKRHYAIQLGKMLQTAPHKDDDVEVPYLKAKHVQWFDVRVSDTPKMWASPRELDQFGIALGDLLVCEGGEGGRCGIVKRQTESCIIQNALHRVRPRQESHNGFLLYVLSSVADRGWFDALNDKATIAHFTREKFGALGIPRPPYAEQAAIVRFLDHANRRIQRYMRAKQKLIALLAEQKQAIIHQAVTGRIDVRTGRPYPAYKSSGVEWLGKVPAHWEVTRVKDEFRCLNRHRLPLGGPERGLMTKRSYDYYGASGVIDKVDDYLFDDELLLIAEDGANLVLRNLPLAIIARGRFWVNNHAHILKPKRGHLGFLAGVMEGLNYLPWISGAAQPKLTQDRLMSIAIAVPPVEEQENIVTSVTDATNHLRRAISRGRRQVEVLREYRTRLVSDAVTGKIDVREGGTEECERNG